jgi:transcriptional regulator with XRE-family HTH domain
MNRELIGKRIKACRASVSGLKLRHVSKMTGLSISYISDVENGKCGISAINLYKLSKIFKKPMEYFLKDCSGGLDKK